jgi:hypothetical protein
VVVVTVAEDDGVEVLGAQVETIEVVGQRLAAAAGIEEDLPIRRLDPKREAVFGAQRRWRLIISDPRERDHRGDA